MSTRRSRQKLPSSEDEFDDEAPVPNASESEEASEVDFEDEDEEGENVEDEEDEDEDAAEEDEDSSEEAYEAEQPAPVRPSRGSRPSRETKKRQLTFYEEDDLLESDEEEEEEELAPPPKKKVSVKLKIPRRSAAVAAASSKKEDEFLEPEAEYKPDVSRMTERQRARLADDEPSERYEESMFARMDEQLLALNRKTQKKKETAEQMAVRKAENARKRADYKVRQLEEEKRETLNKLLKRRANKTRENIDEDAADAKQTLKPRRPVLEHPALVRWVCSPQNSVLGLTE